MLLRVSGQVAQMRAGSGDSEVCRWGFSSARSVLDVMRPPRGGGGGGRAGWVASVLLDKAGQGQLAAQLLSGPHVRRAETGWVASFLLDRAGQGQLAAQLLSGAQRYC